MASTALVIGSGGLLSSTTLVIGSGGLAWGMGMTMSASAFAATSRGPMKSGSKRLSVVAVVGVGVDADPKAMLRGPRNRLSVVVVAVVGVGLDAPVTEAKVVTSALLVCGCAGQWYAHDHQLTGFQAKPFVLGGNDQISSSSPAGESDGGGVVVVVVVFVRCRAPVWENPCGLVMGWRLRIGIGMWWNGSFMPGGKISSSDPTHTVFVLSVTGRHVVLMLVVVFVAVAVALVSESESAAACVVGTGAAGIMSMCRVGVGPAAAMASRLVGLCCQPSHDHWVRGPNARFRSGVVE